MKPVRAVAATFLLTFAFHAAAQQRADAVLLVNSASPQYADAARHVRPYLDHFGVPYTVLDLATTPVDTSIGTFALIIVGHPALDTTGAYLSTAEQQAISAAVLGGTGLVSFDHDLSSGTVGRYQFEQDVFGFGYIAVSSGESVAFTADAPAHYITSKHAAGESITMAQMTAQLLTAPADATVLLRYQGTPHPFVVARSHGLGRAVQWTSSAWMSPAQHRYDYRGPLRGLDDVVWRSLVWAARKPFVMQGLPNFVTMRMDDAQGPFTWAHIAIESGFKPWIGTFYQRLIGDDWIDLARMTQDGTATSSVHSNGVDFFYFDHFNHGDLDATTLAANFADATYFYNTYGVQISSVVIPHFYEIGTNAFPYLQGWGVKHVVTHMTPGLPYDTPAGWPAVDWLHLGPYRLHDSGSQGPGTAANVTYADYLTVPGHPELDNTFFNCVTEIRDDAGYEWFPDAADVPGTIGRGTRQLQRALDSMTLATLFSHEYFVIGNGDVPGFTEADFRTAMQGIASNIASYNPVYVTLDAACDYIKAKHDTRITSALLDGTTLRTTVSGRGEVPTKFMVFTDAGGFIHQESWDIPVYDGVQTVSSTLPVTPAPTLTSLTVSPATATIREGQTRQFSATAAYSDGSSWSVTTSGAWSSSSTAVATVSSTGLATGAGVGAADIWVSFAGSTVSARLDVTEAPLAVLTSTLPAGSQRIAYSASLSATGGRRPYTWTSTSALPGGLTLAPDGTVSGTPTGRGTFTFGVALADAGTSTASATITLVINSSSDVTLWPSSAVPATADRGPDSPVELGVKFRSDVAGAITGLRFYKAAANTGVHTGNLWAPPACQGCAATLLASAVFTGETASGWQEVRFASPVAIDANTLYVASYHTDVGHYARDAAYFTGASRDNAPLHAPSAATVAGNGVYAYGASSAYPADASGVDPNYWVDVVFSVGDPPVLGTIDVTPASPTVDVGSRTQLHASGTLSDGSVADISGQVIWQSSAPAVATVDPLGAVSALAPGTTTVSASHGGVTGATTVTVVQPVARIAITPANPRIVAGGTQQLTATAYDGANNPLTGYTFTWAATGGGTISASGLFTAGSSAGVFVNAVTATAAGVTGATSTETVALASMSLSPTSVIGGSSSTGTVTLSAAAPAGGATVALSSGTAGVTVPASVSVAEGASTATFTVSTTAVAAGVTATITATLGATATATLAVAAPRPATVSFSPAAVTGTASATGTVTLDGPAPAGGVAVALSSDTASAAVPATATVAGGATSGTFTATTAAVGAVTTATITASSGGGTATGTLTVNPAALLSATLNTTLVVGGASPTLTVRLTAAAPAGGAVVALASNNAAATVPATVTVPGGATQATVAIATAPVATLTTGTLTATYLGVTLASANLRVSPPILTGVTLSPATVTGGASSTATITLNGASAGGYVVNLGSSDAAATVPATVTVPAGALSATFTVSTAAVAASTPVTISATAATGGTTRTATLTVAKAALSAVTTNTSIILGGRNLTGTVTLTGNAPAGGIVVTLSDNSGVTTTPASVTVLAGAKSRSFTISTTTVATNTRVTLTATLDGVSRTRAFTVSVPSVTGVTLGTSTLTGGASTTGTVSINGAAPAGGLTVQLFADAPATVPATVTVPAGAVISNAFTVSTAPVVSAAAPVISALAGSVTRTATLSVLAPAVSAVTLAPSSVPGGSAAEGTVTLTGPAPAGGVAVSLSSASPGVAAVPASVTVNENATTATFPVATSVIQTSTGVTLTATGGGASASASLTVRGIAVASIAVTPSTVTGGSPTSATVTLTNAAVTPFTVQLFSSNAAATPPASVTVPAGQATVTVEIPTSTVSSPATATLTALGGSVAATTTLTVNP